MKYMDKIIKALKQYRSPTSPEYIYVHEDDLKKIIREALLGAE